MSQPKAQLTVSIIKADGSKDERTVLVRIDTLNELEYFKHGGILNYVLMSISNCLN